VVREIQAAPCESRLPTELRDQVLESFPEIVQVTDVETMPQ
jgi:hypothetical protein